VYSFENSLVYSGAQDNDTTIDYNLTLYNAGSCRIMTVSPLSVDVILFLISLKSRYKGVSGESVLSLQQMDRSINKNIIG